MQARGLAASTGGYTIAGPPPRGQFVFFFAGAQTKCPGGGGVSPIVYPPVHVCLTRS